MRSNALILDVDGTIINFFPRHYQIFIDFISNYKIKGPSYFQYRTKRRAGIKDEEILQAIGIADKANEFTRFKLNNIEDRKYITYDKLLPKSALTINRLSQRSHILLLSSRKKLIILKNELERFDISGYSDIILTPKNAKKREVNKVLSWIKVHTHKKNSLYIGDGQDDANMATALGLKFIGVTSGITNPYKMKQITNLTATNISEFLNKKTYYENL